MIQVTILKNFDRVSVIVDENTTIRTVLDENNVDYSRAVLNIDGSSLQPGDIDKTFADFHIHEKCYISLVVKTDNA